MSLRINARFTISENTIANRGSNTEIQELMFVDVLGQRKMTRKRLEISSSKISLDFESNNSVSLRYIQTEVNFMWIN